jgi:putative transposase
VRFVFIEAEKVQYPIGVLCSVLQVSRSGFYAWRRRGPSLRTTGDEKLAVEIAAVHQRTKGRYGSPRVYRELRTKGRRVSRKRVERLMRERGIRGKTKRRFRRTTNSNHPYPVAPNILARQFKPTAPNQVWAGDVTYIATDEGWAYLAVLLDLFSRRVVGWAISPVNDTALALAALHRALHSRPVPVGLVHHTDRGSPYASEEYRRALAARGIVASMSRRGDCWDNAVAESFFATLRVELTDDESYPARATAASSIGDYIDGFYNLARLHSHLGYVSPVEFELRKIVEGKAA